jgi:hypothetical protein
MGILKFASDESTRIDLGEGDFIEVRKDMSKRQFNALMSKMPNREISEDGGLTLQEGLEFQQALFESLVVGWSVPEPATVDSYLELDREAADLIDSKLIEHFGSISPSSNEASKVSTSRGKRQRETLPRA